MFDVSICRRKRNKFNEKDTLKSFISYGDSLLLSGKSLPSFVWAFRVIENGYIRGVKRYEGIEMQMYFPAGLISNIFAVAFRIFSKDE